MDLGAQAGWAPRDCLPERLRARCRPPLVRHPGGTRSYLSTSTRAANGSTTRIGVRCQPWGLAPINRGQAPVPGGGLLAEGDARRPLVAAEVGGTRLDPAVAEPRRTVTPAGPKLV